MPGTFFVCGFRDQKQIEKLGFQINKSTLTYTASMGPVIDKGTFYQ